MKARIFLATGLLVAMLIVIGSSVSCQSYSVGDNVRIYESGLTTITVAVDGSAWDDLNEAFAAEDYIGLAALLASGRTFTVQNGTRALVLDKGFTKTKVRVLEGANAGRTGYVEREWVEKE